MVRYLSWIAIAGLLLLTACGRQEVQTVETTGRTEHYQDNNYRKMQQEQHNQRKSSPSPQKEEKTKDVERKESILEKSPLTSEMPDPEKYDLQLVFIGDETFGQNANGIGIPELCITRCKARGYSLTVDGTGAATEDLEVLGNERWSSRSLAGIIKAVKGEINDALFADTDAGIVLSDTEADLSATDYFIIAYGLNDFRHGIPLNNSGNDYDLRTYAGALRYAVASLRERYPGAEIILCSPYYCRFYKDGWMIGDSNTFDQGKGTLRDYMGTCEYIAGEQQVLFLNTYDNLGIDGYTADEYLQDGIYLTDKARDSYADLLARMILNHEEQKNN